MRKNRSFNFGTTLLGSIFLFIATAGVFFSLLLYPSGQNEKEYRTLVEKANPARASLPSAPYKASQHRSNIQKDIFFTRGNERLHLCLTSVEADMVVDHYSASTELIEKMRGVTCLMQEELFYLLPDGREAIKQPNGKLLIRQAEESRPSSWVDPTLTLTPMQRVQYLEAETATYYYKTEQLVADQVKLYRYTLPGHALTNWIENQPDMIGTAKTVEFSLSGKELNFKASHLKAAFYTLGTPS